MAGTLFFGFHALQGLLNPVPRPTEYKSSGNDAVDLLVLGGRAVGAAARFVGDLGQGVIMGVTVVSVCALTFSVALFFTGRGLMGAQLWARIAAGVLMVVLFGASAIAFLSLRISVVGAIAAGLALASGYAIWVVVRG